MNVHILQNPTKVIIVEGNLNNPSRWNSYFALENGNIHNGVWQLGLKTFSYLANTGIKRVANISCNVVSGFERKQGHQSTHFNPPIAQVVLNNDIKSIEQPSFFIMNKVCDRLELDFSFFPSESTVPFAGDSKNIQFQAIFHYVCLTNN